MDAEIYITLKKTVADPQGLTVKHALKSLGFTEVADVRIGKLVDIRLDISDRDIAKEKLTQMCNKLLANPIIEDFQIHIKGE